MEEEVTKASREDEGTKARRHEGPRSERNGLCIGSFPVRPGLCPRSFFVRGRSHVRHRDNPHIFREAMKLMLASENLEHKELVASDMLRYSIERSGFGSPSRLLNPFEFSHARLSD